MIEIVFNLNVSIHMHMLYAIFFFNNLTNYIFFIIKIVFNFKCIHAFTWVTCFFFFLKIPELNASDT